MNFGHISLVLGISMSTCEECLMLYNEIFSVTPVNHPTPSCKDCPHFPCHLPLKLKYCPLDKVQGSVLSGQSPPLSLVQCLHFPFPFSKTLLLLCNLCLYQLFVQEMDRPEIFLTRVFWDHSLVTGGNFEFGLLSNITTGKTLETLGWSWMEWILHYEMAMSFGGSGWNFMVWIWDVPHSLMCWTFGSLAVALFWGDLVGNYPFPVPSLLLPTVYDEVENSSATLSHHSDVMSKCMGPNNYEWNLLKL
jgi:hypothetical protein